jgi:hypothetical protein
MARFRVAGLWLAVAAFVMGGIDWTPDSQFLRAAPSIALNLRLTAADNLPPTSKRVLVSEAAAIWKQVDESQRLRLLDAPMLREYRLGLVLGRAVAHEIGHFLLRTNAHSDSGLMRASIGAREFADPRADSFQLDDETQRQLNSSRAQVEIR